VLRDPLIVLKLGGSVLRDEDSLALAVHEVYRWRRDGWRVVAVVSALAGRTEALLRRCARECARPDPAAVAAVVATGELESSALLGLHLDRAGVPGTVLGPGGLRLGACGDPLDAVPTSVDAAAIVAALERDGVVVAPGYVALDGAGRTVLLGRGGSDLSALFLAYALGADRCRLVKDVGGLFERDPAAPGPPARRFASATWDDALATDGSIVQHKAVRFAREHRISFEIGCFNGIAPTTVGPGPARLVGGAAAPRPLRVALLGLGVVGGGVLAALRRMPAHFEIGPIAVRDLLRPRDVAPADRLTADARAAALDAHVIVEATGDRAVAAVLRSALVRGADVVTANKALVAAQGPALRAAARRGGGRVRFSAAVGGSMPILERLEAIGGGAVCSVRAVVNGTTNFVLDRLAEGVALDRAVDEARARGFAERDPRRDLSGGDAADKLRVIAHTLGGPFAGPLRVPRQALCADVVAQAFARAPRDGALRHVASLQRGRRGPVAAVRLEPLDAGDALAAVRAEQNAAVIERDDGAIEIVRGRGAGRWPTAESIVADLLELTRGRTAHSRSHAAGADQLIDAA
jgi:homoserine dehydrogenase